MLRRAISIAIFLFFVSFSSSKAQSHFYTTLRMPAFDYIIGALNGGDDNERFDNSDGIFLNAGYATQMSDEIFIEAGIEYLIFGKVTSKNTNYKYEGFRTAFAFQAGPQFRTSIDEDDQVLLQFGAVGSMRKLFSDAHLTQYRTGGMTTESVFESKSKSKFHLAVEPQLSFIFTTSKKISYKLGLNYTFINWRRTDRQLNFTDTSFNVPTKRTSNLFFVAGFTF